MAQGCFGFWTGALLVIGALYATLMVGVSGGPNKGEHPMTVTILHGVLFFLLAKGWSRGEWWAYLGLLLATLLLSLWAMSLVGERRAGRLWTARGAMLALHAAMFWIAAFGC